MELRQKGTTREERNTFFRFGIDHVSIKALHVWEDDEVEMIWEEENIV